MGSKDQTSTSSSTQTYTPRGLNDLRDLWDRVQKVSSTPYQAYGGDLVAGLNQTQQSGIANINNAATAAQPWYNQAQDYATQGASAIDPSQIDRYFNPFTSSVIDATQRNFNVGNAEQQQQVVGNAALKNALGGDRVGVAQAELAKQQKLAQDPVLANLQLTGWNNALAAAQADRSAASQGALNFGNLGTGAQNAALSGGQAQIAAGGVDQATQQKALDAAYQQFLQKQAFPYQQLAFATGTGLPILGAQGGTTEGSSTTTTPGPSPWGQLLGAGLTAASFVIPGAQALGPAAAAAGGAATSGMGGFASGTQAGGLWKRGGRIPRLATGGPVMPYGGASYIPTVAMPQGGGAPVPSYAAPQAHAASPSGWEGINPAAALSAFRNMRGMASRFSSAPTMMPLAGDGTGFNRGGGVPRNRLADKIRSIRAGLRDGGMVMDTMRDPNGIYMPRFAFGGGVEEEMPGWTPGGFAPEQSYNQSPVPAWTDIPIAPPGAVDPSSPFGQGPGASPVPVGPAMAPASPMAAPPMASSPPLVPSQGYGAMASAAPAPAPSPMANGAPERGGGLFTNFGLSEDARLALLSAGLGMMASKSPFALTAIGEGGLQGVKSYTENKQNRTKTELEARKLMQSAEQFNQTLAETKRYHDTLAASRRDAAQDRLDIASRTAYPGKGVDAQGQTVEGLYQFNPESREYVFKPGVVLTAKGASGNALLDDETIDSMARQYRAGDRTVLQNLGRGAQGAENVVKLRTRVAQQLKENGATPEQMALAVAEFEGLKAGQRTLGTRTANIEMPVAEAKNLVPQALEMSEKVSRTKYPALNSVILAAEKGTGDENTVRLGIAVNSLINVYSRAISPTGTPTVSDKEHARELLSAAWSKGQFKAGVDQLMIELQAAQKSPGDVKDKFRELYGRGATSGPAATPAPPAAPTQIHSVPEYEALPPGTKFIDPDGVSRTKQ